MRKNIIPRVKICCIGNLEEAELAIDCGASAIGLVSEMPSGPGIISEDKIAEIAARTPPAVSTFLLTSKTEVNSILDQHKRCRTNTIQLCDRLLEGTYEDLINALPGISIVQVIHVTGEESIEEAAAIAGRVHGILLDSGNQNLPVKKLGGTGRTHDWIISQKIREAINIPLFLAGGLNQDNIQTAVSTVHPFAVDVCSGVRTNGQLDENKLIRFFKNINEL